MSTRPLVSIITINYNQASVTCDLLRSIAQLEYAPIEVIVVDNASKTDPTEDVLKTYPDARVIRNEQNLGFAAGNNVALKVANG